MSAPDTMLSIIYGEVIPRDDTGKYVYTAIAFSDNLVCVSLTDENNLEKYQVDAHVHPSEQVTDTVHRLIDRIEDEYFGGK